ncbi:hypothetical protein FHN55_21510, partial [Streptomyces sp. NP160]
MRAGAGRQPSSTGPSRPTTAPAAATGAAARPSEGSAREAGARGASTSATSATTAPTTAPDGFTMRDLVSYNEKHNEANGEGGRDGESHNRSWNCGVEGE